MSKISKSLADQFKPGKKTDSKIQATVKKALHNQIDRYHENQSNNKALDLPTTADKLNAMATQIPSMNLDQMDKFWDQLESMGNAIVWTRGHIALQMHKSYGEGEILKFAESKNLDKRSIYRYMKLAELFPKVDKVLSPSFFFKAIEVTHGDKVQTTKLIEEARERKKDNPKYSVREFTADVCGDNKKTKNAKKETAKDIIHKIMLVVQKLEKIKNLDNANEELSQLKQRVAELGS